MLQSPLQVVLEWVWFLNTFSQGIWSTRATLAPFSAGMYKVGLSPLPSNGGKWVGLGWNPRGPKDYSGHPGSDEV